MSLRFLYSASSYRTLEFSMEESLDTFFEFRKSNHTFFKRDFEVLRYSKTLLVVLGFKFRETLLKFKESLVCVIQMSYRALKTLSIDFLEPRISFLESRKTFNEFKFSRLLFSDIIRINTHSEEMVINESAVSKVFGKKIFLFFSWADSILESFKHYVLLYFSSNLVRIYT